MQVLLLNQINMRITWNGTDKQGALIHSLHHDDNFDLIALAQKDAIESMVLAHFRAGIDVYDARYLDGVRAVLSNCCRTELG